VAANYIRRMILDKFLVTDQVAIVTASGRGIGAGAAIALAQAGADVVLAARTEDQLREVAKQVEAAGRRAVVVPGDLTDFDLMASLADTAHSEFGRLDIVVNNMGGTMPRPFLDTSPRFLEEAFRFNVSAGHALLRAAVPRMLEGDHPGGAIVGISSVMGHVAGRGYVGYGTVKGAVEQYTRLASRDLAPRIRVNAIGVGSTATSALDIVMSTEELRTAMEDVTPLKRIGHVEDIAAAILYLVSPAGAYVTGKVIEVDGGLQSPNLEFPIPDL
jgi:7-alpha-hydroxysteroid dehydrogenase